MLVETSDLGDFDMENNNSRFTGLSASFQMEKSIFLMILCKTNFFAVLDRDVRIFEDVQVCLLVRCFVDWFARYLGISEARKLVCRFRQFATRQVG